MRLSPVLKRLENRGSLVAGWNETEIGRETKGRSQLESKAAGWQRLTKDLGLILAIAEGGAK